MYPRIIQLFLRIALSFSFLSAVADRLGFWPKEISVWGNWQNFLSYTQDINPWFPEGLIPSVGEIATALEIILAIALLIGLKTKLTATISGILLLIFALAITFSSSIKGAFDFSVFTAAAAAFALSLMDEKFLSVDGLISNTKKSK